MIEKLFTSKNRVKILMFLLFEKEKTYIREMSRMLKLSPNAVKREIDNLCRIGLILNEDSEIKVNKNSNIINAVREILLKTDYVYYPIKSSLKKSKISVALIFGSFANNKDNISSDVDLLIIGDVTQEEVFNDLKKPESEIGREINPVVWNAETLRKNKGGAFFKDVMKKKKIFIMGDES